MHCKTQGIVLRETNYKEADKLLTVLTRDMGKRTVKARGLPPKGERAVRLRPAAGVFRNDPV